MLDWEGPRGPTGGGGSPHRDAPPSEVSGEEFPVPETVINWRGDGIAETMGGLLRAS